MKKKITVIVLALLLILGFAAYGVYGDNAGDITNDPLVSLSYLNEDYWQKIQAAINEAINNLPKSEVGSDNDTSEDTNVPDEDTGDDSSFLYEVIHLEQNDIILADTPCEIILRSGSAVAYLSGNESGISDLTAGVDIKEGEELVANHLLLVPRGKDGRGFMVTSAEAYIMMRGGYSFAEATTATN